MDFADKAVEIILGRYDSLEYKAGIASIASDPQKIYGATDKIHAQAVLDWTCKLWGHQVDGNVPKALRISAVGHDWERAFECERDKLEIYPHENGKPDLMWYAVHKSMHAHNSARILRRELADIVPNQFMIDVTYIVTHHEIGGARCMGEMVNYPDFATGKYNLNLASEILKQGDSLAFFNGLDTYVEWRNPAKVRQKASFMFDRVKDPQVRQWIKELDFESEFSREVVGSLG
jgi:hypothetical protein